MSTFSIIIIIILLLLLLLLFSAGFLINWIELSPGL